VKCISQVSKEVSVSIIPKSYLKCCLSNAEDGTQDDIPWEDGEHGEQTGEGASSSENESETEGHSRILLIK
jgi:hypothetical protein